jgi:hypothetical protein
MQEHGPAVILAALAMAWTLFVWALPLNISQPVRPISVDIMVALSKG